MRLICPNCDAQYEIPDDAMLPEGRDVQCSNCEQTWFQEYPKPIETVVIARQTVSAKSKVSTRDTDVPLEDDGETSSPDTPSAISTHDNATPPPPRRKSLDPAVANVLQQEAQLEARARQHEGFSSVETQPELGLSASEDQHDSRSRAREARDRMARVRGEASEAPIEKTAVSTGSRRALLPDIEEINSTLRANNERSPNNDPGQTAQVEVRERRKFGRGFTLMVVLAALFALSYVMAPQLIDALPEAEPWITEYVSLVDQGRIWLNAQVTTLLVWLDTIVASADL